jgi:hypothetical protein
MLPKTLVLGFNLHGEIPLNEKGNPYTKILKLKQLIQINAVTYGVPNVSTFETYDKLSKIVSDFNCENNIGLDNEDTSENLIDYTTKIQNLLIENNEEEVRDIEKQHKKLTKQCGGKQTEMLNKFGSYVHNSDKSYKIYSFIESDIILNKTFYKFTPEEIKYYELSEDINQNSYFNKIVVYNMEGKVDIFELLESIGYKLTEITLFNLIDLLHGMGVENLISIDLSCFVFKNIKGELISDRANRITRRNIERANII